MIIIKTIIYQLLKERSQWILWVPVWFAAGIGCYFSLSSEPNLFIEILTLSTLLVITLLLKRHVILCIFFTILTLFVCGMLVAHLHSLNANSPLLSRHKMFTHVTGIITAIEERQEDIRITIAPAHFSNEAIVPYPTYIRIVVRDCNQRLAVGDEIRLHTTLHRPPLPPIIGAYDFARSAYFKQIGAVGYNTNCPTILHSPPPSTLASWLFHIRSAIATRIDKHLPSPSSEIANALILGKRQPIEATIMQDLRTAGIAHLLAISGMHLALVSSLFFLFFRYLCSLSPRFSLTFNNKKIAACGAILGAGFYLLLTNSPISAQRAFIMVSLLLLSMIVDRVNTPLRAVALAAFIILLLSPQHLLSPGFQMSFSAAIALIRSYEWFNKDYVPSYYRRMQKTAHFIRNLFFSSLIAGAATMPFAIYHFNHYTPYGLFANLLAIPITSFWVMPLALLSVVVMPLGLEVFPLSLMHYGIASIVSIASLIAEQPSASIALISPSSFAMITITFGGLWICLWRTRWCYFGIAPIVLGLCSLLWQSPPTILIEPGDSSIAIIGKDNTYYFNRLNKSFNHHFWQQKTAHKGHNITHPLSESPLVCDDTACIASIEKKHISFVYDPTAFAKECTHSALLINFTTINAKRICHRFTDMIPQIISYFDLLEGGTHSIKVTKDAITLQHVKHSRGKRLWSRN